MPYQRRRTAIGKRRERASLQARTTTSDGMGGQTVTWATVARTWVAPEPIDGRDVEAMRGDQLTVVHNYHFNMRYRHGVRPTPTMRLLWRSKTLEIRTVADDLASNDRLIVQCSEVQDANAAA